MGDAEKNSQASGRAGAGSRVGGGRASRSWGTTASGQSVSTTSGGSTGSPLSLARVSHGDDVGAGSPLSMATTPARDSAFLKMNHLDIHGDDAGSQGDIGNKKKKRGQRATTGDKSGRGLRQFSMKVILSHRADV